MACMELGQRAEKTLDLAAPAWPPHGGKNELDLQMGGHLLDVLRGEIAAVVGVENLRDAADGPVRPALVPNRLPEREGRLDCRRRGERKSVARHGAAVVVEDNGQPRFLRAAAVVDQDEHVAGTLREALSAGPTADRSSL